MRMFLYGVALLHAVFMLAELFPWKLPFALKKATAKLPAGQRFTPEQETLVATVVHNAGIYNAILAGGLAWAASTTDVTVDTARVLLAGAALAGVFGAATLKSPLTYIQALAGLAGLWLFR
jgi:uncharacterized membrane protein